jgi:hypothetical protein
VSKLFFNVIPGLTRNPPAVAMQKEEGRPRIKTGVTPFDGSNP